MPRRPMRSLLVFGALGSWTEMYVHQRYRIGNVCPSILPRARLRTVQTVVAGAL
jgi:hypothetical protein